MIAFGRRKLLLAAAGAALSSTFARRAAASPGPQAGSGGDMRTRTIPRTGEALPVIGLGTWQTFDVGPDEAARAPLREVLRSFLHGGGRVIDSSPMYGRAEAVTGELLASVRPEPVEGRADQRPGAPRPFLATKVWTTGKAEGEAQGRESMRRLRTDRLDLLQIHNLLDWQVQLPTLRDWKRKGTIRYLGVTHYSPSRFAELERLLRHEALDFVQLPYSLATREAEARLLPAAADTGTAVLVMRPFEEGELFRRVKGQSLPAWAAEVGCTAWSQVFLKFILGHPAVTAVLPATADPRHQAENLGAGQGPLPDAELRRRMVAALEG